VSMDRAGGERAVLVRSAAADIDRGTAVRALVIAALLVFVLFGMPALFGVYWEKIFTAVAIYSVVALGLNLLYGRVGMVSLCQIALLAVGAWAAARILYATSIPFPLVLLLAGLITAAVGTLFGLPALRISGLHLALITLMFAGAFTLVLNVVGFPNGGGGFLGVLDFGAGPNIRRPEIAKSDTAYFRYCVIVAALMFLLALWQIVGKRGRAWAAIRESESAARAAGINITVYKLWAFAIASFMTGVAGGLMGASGGQLTPLQFPTQDSIVLFAAVLMGGIYSLWGAVVAGLLIRFLPALLEQWGLSYFLLLGLFGAGILQVLATAPGGLADQVPKDLKRLGRLISRGVGRLAGARGPAA
jgi:branched-chain amino acid transport system permease protein